MSYEEIKKECFSVVIDLSDLTVIDDPNSDVEKEISFESTEEHSE
tara:strand:- start:561 stop:695 length:135 start_codon:yes stop_codon:yes gene_type:complete